jgi:hypothetical protein
MGSSWKRRQDAKTYSLILFWLDIVPPPQRVRQEPDLRVSREAMGLKEELGTENGKAHGASMYSESQLSRFSWSRCQQDF